MRTIVKLSTLVVMLVTASGAAPASAQTSSNAREQVLFIHPQEAHLGFDIAGGYTLIRDSGRGKTMPAAWLLGVSITVAPQWAAVGEADGAYKSVTTDLGEQQYRTHSFMAGARRFLHATNRRAPFVQLLAGTSCYCGSTVQPDGDHSNGLALQAGGGLDLPIARRLALRMQADLRHVNGDGLGFSQFRVAVGGVVGVTAR